MEESIEKYRQRKEMQRREFEAKQSDKLYGLIIGVVKKSERRQHPLIDWLK